MSQLDTIQSAALARVLAQAMDVMIGVGTPVGTDPGIGSALKYEGVVRSILDPTRVRSTPTGGATVTRLIPSAKHASGGAVVLLLLRHGTNERWLALGETIGGSACA